MRVVSICKCRYHLVVFALVLLVLIYSVVLGVWEIRRASAIAEVKEHRDQIYSTLVVYFGRPLRKSPVDKDETLRRFKRYSDTLHGEIDASHRGLFAVFPPICIFSLFICYAAYKPRRVKTALDTQIGTTSADVAGSFWKRVARIARIPFWHVAYSCIYTVFGIALISLSWSFSCTIFDLMRKKESAALSMLSNAVEMLDANANVTDDFAGILREISFWLEDCYQLMRSINLDIFVFLFVTGIVMIVIGMVVLKGRKYHESQ